VKPREIIPREVAHRDVDEAVTHYLENASRTVALGFIDALETAYDHIRRHPATGSLRYAHELDLPGLRSWSLSRYPYIVFYVEQPDYIDVWRVLHGQRDIPAWMHEPGGGPTS